MNIIIINSNGQRALSVTRTTLAIFVLLALALVLGLFSYFYTSSMNDMQVVKKREFRLAEDDQLAYLLVEQKKSLEATQLSLESKLENMTARVSQMQARMIQMEQLGNKLVKVAGLKRKEFDFSSAPAMGGPNEERLDTDAKQLESRMAGLLNDIESHENQLAILEALIEQRIYANYQTPKGRPAKKGWISSYFGMRKDPFTGKMSRHRGIDVAAKEGSDLVATASGVVTWVGERSGYGLMVEIDHGKGLQTRYGHCKSISVKLGQKINQGEVIGEIGSTGRSTGPHVHYEVLKNGVKVNPIKYARKDRAKVKL